MGSLHDPASQRTRAACVLAFTACFSRHCFVWVSFTQTTEAVIDGCEAAWAFFGGVFATVIPDNLSAVVDKANPTEPLFNQAFVEYAQSRGFVMEEAARLSRGRNHALRGCEGPGRDATVMGVTRHGTSGGTKNMATQSALTRTVEGRELPPPGRWSIDPSHSEVQLVVRHMMVAKVRGRFREFSGAIHIAEVPEESSVEATINTASIDTGDPNRDAHLRSPTSSTSRRSGSKERTRLERPHHRPGPGQVLRHPRHHTEGLAFRPFDLVL